MQRKRVTRGFSLIELMLVIVVIGLGSIYTVNFIKSKQRQAAIESTVQKLKNMLQLAQIYHSRYDQWPSSTQDFVTYFGISELDFCTQWLGNGDDPVTGEKMKACPNRAIIGFLPPADYSGITPSRDQPITANDPRLYPTFYVLLNLPAETLAQEVASNLPSADLINSTLIRASTTARLALPQAADYMYGYLMSGGLATDGERITFPGNCLDISTSSGTHHTMEKHIFFAFKQGLTDFYKKLDYKWIIFKDPKYRVLYSGTTTEYQAGSPPTSVRLKSADCYGSKGGSSISTCGGETTTNKKTSRYVVGYYLTLCVPYKQWQVAFDSPSSWYESLFLYAQRNSQTGEFMEDYGQCTSSWASVGNCNLGRNNPLWDVVI